MKRKFNVINYIVTFGVTLLCVFLAVYLCGKKYSLGIWEVIGFFAIGLVVTGFLCALFHELGHLLFGKLNGFVLESFTVWFFRWERRGKKLKFSLVFSFDESGSTSMVKKKTDGMEKGLKAMTVGGLIFSLVSMLFALPVLIIAVPYWLYCIVVVFLPVGAYYFFGNALPAKEGGALNDGGVLYCLKKGEDETKVVLSLLTVQSELYGGKTFAEIDEKILFDLPQLPEDSMNFITLLNYRYYYYLDKEDYDNAKKVTSRLLSLEDYMPKQVLQSIKTDALYNACTFDYNEEVADELMYELEDVLNKDDSATSYRVRLAYISCVKGEKKIVEQFYNKSLKQANKCHLSGLKRFENKLLQGIRAKF